MSPPLLTYARAIPGRANAATISSATLPATAAIAVMKVPCSPYGRQASDHSARDSTARPDRGRGRRAGEIGAQQRQLGDELGEHAVESRPGLLDRGGHGVALALGADDAVDRAVLEVPATGVEPATHRAGR